MTLDMDLVLSEIGDFGPGQRRYFLVFCTLNCYAAFHMLLFAFTGYPMPFQCQAKDQDSPNYDSCPANSVDRCEELTFPGTDSESTIVSEWGLVCDRAWLAPITMSAFMAGVMVGALVMGAAADAYGRKKTLFVSLLNLIVFNALSGMVGGFALHTALRFVVGFAQSGLILACFVLLNELIGAQWRGMLGTCLQAAFAVGIMFYAAIASSLTQWRQLTFFVSAAGMPFMLFFFYLPESPRWLQSRGRAREAIIVLRALAVKNGTTLKEQTVANGSKDSEVKDNKDKEVVVGGSVSQLFTHPKLLQITLIQIFSWLTNSFCYYGLTLAAASSSGDGQETDESSSSRYMTTAMSGAVELPAYVLTVFLLPLLGRKLTLVGYMVAGGAALALIPVLGQVFGFYVWSAAMFSKFSIAASFAVIYVHSGEIFPTCIRNSAMGLVSFAARVGGMLAPQGVALGQVVANLHLLVFGGLMLASGLLNLRLPETTGRPLPETVGDMLKASSEAMSTPSRKRPGDGYKKLSVEDGEGFEGGAEEDDGFETEIRIQK